MGFAWWQIDISAAVIRSLEIAGLAHDVKRARSRRSKHQDGVSHE
jgi:fatty-acid desaturase